LGKRVVGSGPAARRDGRRCCYEGVRLGSHGIS
jgi:hypothetical protein